MNKLDLIKLIDSLKVTQEITIHSSMYEFGLVKINLLHSEVIVFGSIDGYYSTWKRNNENTDTIVDEINRHLTNYKTGIRGKVYADLSECKIVVSNILQ